MRQVSWSRADAVGASLAHGFAVELDAMGVVDQAVEDGVGEGRLADEVVPAVDRELGW
jgi:hypothetical protein